MLFFVSPSSVMFICDQSWSCSDSLLPFAKTLHSHTFLLFSKKEQFLLWTQYLKKFQRDIFSIPILLVICIDLMHFILFSLLQTSLDELHCETCQMNDIFCYSWYTKFSICASSFSFHHPTTLRLLTFVLVFLVACYATLWPTMSVGLSDGRSVRVSFFPSFYVILSHFKSF